MPATCVTVFVPHGVRGFSLVMLGAYAPAPFAVGEAIRPPRPLIGRTSAAVFFIVFIFFARPKS